MKISINGSSELMHADVARLVAHAKQAADDGMAGWWLAQVGLVDALTVLALAGAETGDMELGTAVNATFPIHPTALAGKALTTQGAIGGRLTLGLGVNHAPVVDHTWGMKFEKPIRHMRDYLSCLMPLLETGTADYAGEDYTARFEGVRPCAETPGMVLAAMGPQMLKVAGVPHRRHDPVDDRREGHRQSDRARPQRGGGRRRPARPARDLLVADRRDRRRGRHARLRRADPRRLRRPAVVSGDDGHRRQRGPGRRHGLRRRGIGSRAARGDRHCRRRPSSQPPRSAAAARTSSAPGRCSARSTRRPEAGGIPGATFA